MRRIALFLFLLLSLTALRAQNLNTFSDSLIPKNGSINYFTFSDLGYLYLLSDRDAILFNPANAMTRIFSSNELGIPHSLHTRDPLKTLLFYRETAVICILDNNFSEQTRIDLRSLGIIDPRAVTNADDGALWIYDAYGSRLIRMNYLLQRTEQVIDLQQITGMSIQASQLDASRNWLVLKSAQAYFVFDAFGSYLRMYADSAQPALIQLQQNTLITAHTGQALLSRDLKTLREESLNDFKIPASASQAWLYRSQIWYLDRRGWLSRSP